MQWVDVSLCKGCTTCDCDYILNALLHPPEQCWRLFGSSAGAAGAVFSDTDGDTWWM